MNSFTYRGLQTAAMSQNGAPSHPFFLYLLALSTYAVNHEVHDGLGH